MYPRPSCLVSIFGQPVLRKQILVINYNKFIFLYEKNDVIEMGNFELQT